VAQLIKTTGEVVETQPTNGKNFTLGEMQSLVDGYVEVIHTGQFFDPGMVMLCNEDGRLLGNLKPNPLASSIAGRDLVGNVVYCKRSEVG
jgi:hypothetical protein